MPTAVGAPGGRAATVAAAAFTLRVLRVTPIVGAESTEAARRRRWFLRCTIERPRRASPVRLESIAQTRQKRSPAPSKSPLESQKKGIVVISKTRPKITTVYRR